MGCKPWWIFKYVQFSKKCNPARGFLCVRYAFFYRYLWKNLAERDMLSSVANFYFDRICR